MRADARWTILLLAASCAARPAEPRPPDGASSPPGSEAAAPGPGEAAGPEGAPPASPALSGPCAGGGIDLAAIMASGACDRPCSGEGSPDVAAALGTRLEVTPARVEAGGEVELRAVLQNRGDRPLELPFVAHAGPMFVAGATDAGGRDVGDPEGPPPLAEGEVYMPGPPSPVCITLAPGGEAHVAETWRAVQWRWAAGHDPTRPPSAEPAREVAAPLPPGRYRLRLTTMLQARVPEEVAAPSAWVEVLPARGR